MKAVIDIGSNSVRLLLKGKKYVETTALGSGLAHNNLLSEPSISQTVNAVISFYDFAIDNGASEVFVFATEAVRCADNRLQFLNILEDFNIKVDVLTKEWEAKVGFLGAYTGGKQAILDIGGASSELIIGENNVILYNHSLPIGAVRLADIFNGNIRELSYYIKLRLKEYYTTPCFDELISIGGTSSTIVAILESLDPYDETKVHGYKLTKKAIWDCINKIFAMPLEARYNIKGLPPKKAGVIAPGGLLLYHIMDYLKIDVCTVSELDNLEGYLSLKEKLVELKKEK